MEDLVGKRFHRLVILKREGSRVDKKNKKRRLWLCQCDCGTLKFLTTHDLRLTKSCGCQRIESSSIWGKKSIKNIQHLGTIASTKHGLRNTRIYTIWKGIKQRCFYEKCPSYKNYGGRGITMCDEWKNDVKCFYDWAIANGYNENLSIDRIDNDGNYEPTNCRWITKAENSRKARLERRNKC